MKLKQFLLSILSGIFILFIFPTQSYAQIVFTDNFSNGYEKWQDERDTFDLWSIIDEKANVFVNQGSTLAELVPKDEFWNDNWKNYIYKVDYTYFEGADKLLSWWYIDPLNWYQFHFVSNQYILSHVKNGYEVFKKAEPFILNTAQTYKMEVHANDGNIKFFVDGQQIFDIDDPTFDNDHGKIGIKSGAGSIFPTHVQFDNVEVSLISNITDYLLTINPLKQIDILWRDEVYDSATNWAGLKNTIGDWGCLLTSINMVLDYYDIKTFTDGTLITPSTLNQWLIEQEDGFIYKGLINWSAITRLAKQLHDQNNTTNLEYSRISNQPFLNSINEIKDEKPVIIELPGHFVVANGFTKEKDDIFISDPYYPIDKLSQYQSTISSARLLTPSNTDLSYIQISHEESINVLVTKDGFQLDNYQSYLQNIISINNNQESPKATINEISKPESGKYNLTIFNNNDSPINSEVRIFTYDIDANYSNLSFSGIIGSINNPTVLEINYDKNGQSTISSKSNFNNLLIDLNEYENNHEISKHYVVYELSELTKAGLNANSINKIRYINAIKTTINWYSDYISNQAKNNLELRLNQIQINL